MGPELILIFAWVITRSIFNYKVDREYARKGLDSPRNKVKMAKLAAAGQPPAATGPARPGAKGYFRELWDDAWDDAHDRHKRIRQEKKAGTYQRVPVGERAAGFGQWLWEGNRPSDVVPPQTGRRSDGPAGTTAAGGDPFSPPPPQAANGPRYACPVCGDTLTQRDGAWLHPAGSTCASAAHPTPVRNGAAKPATVRATAPAPVGARRTAPQPAKPAGGPPASGPLIASASKALADADPYAGLQAMTAAEDAVYNPTRLVRRQPADVAATTASAPAGTWPADYDGRVAAATEPTTAEPKPKQQIREALVDGQTSNDALYQTVGQALDEVDPDGSRGPAANVDLLTAVMRDNSSFDWEPDEITADAAHCETTDPTSNGGPDMSDSGNPATRFFDTYNPPNLLSDVRADTVVGQRMDGYSTSTRHTNGGTTMSDNTDLLDYTTAVAEHEQVLAKLREQHAEATAFKQHITGATTAVEHMDGNRGVLATGLAAIAEGMEGSRFGADATSGSAEAAGALTAGSIAAVQEHIEAANDTNDRWITELDASIEAVQASLQHLKSTYGEAAAVIQETGVKAQALEEH